MTQEMIPVWQAAALGAVQGLTEFLPISSSAHLKLMPWALNWQPPANEMAFDVALHFGTLLAVCTYFFFEWLLIVASYIGDLRMKRWAGGAKGSLLPKIVLASVPAAIVGLLLEERIEAIFYSSSEYIWILACTLAGFGVLLVIAEKAGKQTRDMAEITYPLALAIGCAQALAVVPGVSRSGVTILAALLLGLTRPAAARFSFLMSTPIIAGAALLQIDKLRPQDINLSLITGLATSALVGMAAIMFLLKYVQTRSYLLFAVYRWILAAAVIALFMYRQQPRPALPGVDTGRPAAAVPATTVPR